MSRSIRKNCEARKGFRDRKATRVTKGTLARRVRKGLKDIPGHKGRKAIRERPGRRDQGDILARRGRRGHKGRPDCHGAGGHLQGDAIGQVMAMYHGLMVMHFMLAALKIVFDFFCGREITVLVM